MSGSRHYKSTFNARETCGIWTYRIALRNCTDLLGRLERRQPLRELAVRGARARDDGGHGNRLEEMTGDAMAGSRLAQLRLLGRTARLGMRAAGMEAAARRRIERARDVALQHHALGPQGGVRLRNRRQQRVGVG